MIYLYHMMRLEVCEPITTPTQHVFCLVILMAILDAVFKYLLVLPVVFLF